MRWGGSSLLVSGDDCCGPVAVQASERSGTATTVCITGFAIGTTYLLTTPSCINLITLSPRLLVVPMAVLWSQILVIPDQKSK